MVNLDSVLGFLVKTAANCPDCGAADAYQGFSGGWECDNQNCKNFSQRHADAMSGQLDTDDDEEGDDVCEGCGVALSDPGRRACDDCFACDKCDEFFPGDEMVSDEHGNHYWEEHGAICHECGYAFDSDNGYYYGEGTDYEGLYCDGCEGPKCTVCGGLVDALDDYNEKWPDDQICSGCGLGPDRFSQQDLWGGQRDTQGNDIPADKFKEAWEEQRREMIKDLIEELIDEILDGTIDNDTQLQDQLTERADNFSSGDGYIDLARTWDSSGSKSPATDRGWGDLSTNSDRYYQEAQAQDTEDFGEIFTDAIQDLDTNYWDDWDEFVKELKRKRGIKVDEDDEGYCDVCETSGEEDHAEECRECPKCGERALVDENSYDADGDRVCKHCNEIISETEDEEYLNKSEDEDEDEDEYPEPPKLDYKTDVKPHLDALTDDEWVQVWDHLNKDELVTIDWEPDEDWDPDTVNPEDDPEIKRMIEQDGVWGMVGKYKDADDKWVTSHEGSVWGCVGQDGGGYEDDIRRTVIDELLQDCPGLWTDIQKGLGWDKQIPSQPEAAPEPESEAAPSPTGLTDPERHRLQDLMNKSTKTPEEWREFTDLFKKVQGMLKRAMKCPECGTEDTYQGLFGPPECLNRSCSNFNQGHYDKTYGTVCTVCGRSQEDGAALRRVKGKLTCRECWDKSKAPAVQQGDPNDQVGWLEGGRALCDGCQSGEGVPLYRVNVLPYSQDCAGCGARLVDGGVSTQLFTRAFLRKEAEKCPACGNSKAYLGAGFNPPECPEENCRFFSQRQKDEVEGNVSESGVTSGEEVRIEQMGEVHPGVLKARITYKGFGFELSTTSQGGRNPAPDHYETLVWDLDSTDPHGKKWDKNKWELGGIGSSLFDAHATNTNEFVFWLRNGKVDHALAPGGKVASLRKTAIDCPECGTKNAYQPMFGPLECSSPNCQNYNPGHAEKQQTWEAQQTPQDDFFKGLQDAAAQDEAERQAKPWKHPEWSPGTLIDSYGSDHGLSVECDESGCSFKEMGQVEIDDPDDDRDFQWYITTGSVAWDELFNPQGRHWQGSQNVPSGPPDGWEDDESFDIQEWAEEHRDEVMDAVLEYKGYWGGEDELFDPDDTSPAQEFYEDLDEKHGHKTAVFGEGPHPCSCRDCFEVAHGKDEFCRYCNDAGCSGESDCQASRNFLGSEEEWYSPPDDFMGADTLEEKRLEK